MPDHFHLSIFSFANAAGWDVVLFEFELGLCFRLSCFVVFGVLQFGTELSDDASAFFFCSFVVEVDQSLQDFFVFKMVRQAVSVKDRHVEIVMDLLEY